MKIDNTWYIKPANIREEISSGGVVVCKKDMEILVALTRENSYPDFVLPKGHLEKNESLVEAAVREIAEEAGLDNIKLICSLGIKERLDAKKKYWKIVHYFLFTTNYISNDLVEWFPIENLPEMFFPEQRKLIEESRAKIISSVK